MTASQEPPALRKYVSDNHFVDTFAFHGFSGREVIARFGYPLDARVLPIPGAAVSRLRGRVPMGLRPR